MQILDISGVLHQCLIELPAAGQPVRHSLCGLVEHEELQLRAQFLVVALHSFLDHLQVILELVFVRESIQIHSLHLVSVLIASPVSAGNGLDLECDIHEELGVVDVGSAAQIYEILTGIIHGDLLIFGQILDQFRLELLILEDVECFRLVDLFDCPCLSSLYDLTHLVLDGLEICFGNGGRKDEVIIAAVRDLRSDRILHFLAIDLNYCLRQNMSQRMAVHFQELFFFHDLFLSCHYILTVLHVINATSALL